MAGAPDDSALQSPEEQLQIDALRAELAEDLRALGAAASWPDVAGDIRLLRFLRGHGSENAAAAYRRMLATRATTELDRSRDQLVGRRLAWAELPPPSAEVGRHYKLVLYAGQTRDCDLVQIEDTGANDAAGIMDEVGEDRFKHCFHCMGELRSMVLDQRSREAGRLVQVGAFPCGPTAKGTVYFCCSLPFVVVPLLACRSPAGWCRWSRSATWRKPGSTCSSGRTCCGARSRW
eukprot:SAG22_NODE_1055_length_5789_cov_3.943234_4_plen_234_part_00